MYLLRENTDQKEEGTFGGQGKEKRSREVRDGGRAQEHGIEVKKGETHWTGWG